MKMWHQFKMFEVFMSQNVQVQFITYDNFNFSSNSDATMQGEALPCSAWQHGRYSTSSEVSSPACWFAEFQRGPCIASVTCHKKNSGNARKSCIQNPEQSKTCIMHELIPFWALNSNDDTWLIERLLNTQCKPQDEQNMNIDAKFGESHFLKSVL